MWSQQPSRVMLIAKITFLIFGSVHAHQLSQADLKVTKSGVCAQISISFDSVHVCSMLVPPRRSHKRLARLSWGGALAWTAVLVVMATPVAPRRRRVRRSSRNSKIQKKTIKKNYRRLKLTRLSLSGAGRLTASQLVLMIFKG